MLNAIYRRVGKHLAPQGERSRLSVLIYHRVLKEEDPLFPNEVTANSFDKQLAELGKVFNILPLEEAIMRLKCNDLPACPACITFDDGYADNVSIALPILKKYNFHATFFIATSYLDGGRMFNDTIIHAIRMANKTYADLTQFGLQRYKIETIEDKINAINSILKYVKYLSVFEREKIAKIITDRVTDIEPPTDLMMSSEQLKELTRFGMGVGGHTARHPILAKLNSNDVKQEIEEGREYLESVLGEKIKLFAYPNGKPGVDYLPEQSDILRKMNFIAAFSTQWGVAHRNSDIFQVPRFTPYTKKISHFTPMLIRNLTHKQ